jgi:hypothetical protein
LIHFPSDSLWKYCINHAGDKYLQQTIDTFSGSMNTDSQNVKVGCQAARNTLFPLLFEKYRAK